MSEPQLVSSDPNYGMTPPPTGPHPEARMSAGTPGPISFPADSERVTLDDLRTDPLNAMARIGAAIKRDVSDPKLWLGLAASYFAPKVFSAAAPVVARAAAAVGRGAGAIEPSDIVGMIPKQVVQGAKIVQKVGTAMREPIAASASPAPPVEPIASSPVAPAPSGAAPLPQAEPAPPLTAPPSTAAPPQSVPTQAANSLPDQRALNEAALAIRRQAYQARTASATAPATPAAPNVKLTAAETKAFMDLMQRGMPSADAMKNVLMQRELVASLGTPTPTAAQTRFPKGMRGKTNP